LTSTVCLNKIGRERKKWRKKEMTITLDDMYERKICGMLDVCVEESNADDRGLDE
jgi:hypothetical protein